MSFDIFGKNKICTQSLTCEPELLSDTTKVELDEKFIDFNFHSHLRHQGNKEHAKNYLKWETNLIKKMDEEEIDFFRELL